MTAMQDILQCLQMERGQWVSRNINEEGGRGNLLQRVEFSTFYFLLHYRRSGGVESTSWNSEFWVWVLSLQIIPESCETPHIIHHWKEDDHPTTWQPWSFHNPHHLDLHYNPTQPHIIVFQGSMFHCRSTLNFSFFTSNCVVPDSQIKSATVTEQIRAYFRSAIGAEMGAQSTHE